ncbi:MAG: hypothetical protein ACI4FZ_03005 [Lachnospiraceae bacterium]
MGERELTRVFGEKALENFRERQSIEKQINELMQKNELLLKQANHAFYVNISLTDVIVAVETGVLCGAVNGCFKSFVPQKGKLRHKHSTTRTAVDYKVPKPEGMSGSVQGFHRQIGPGHDIGRFKEALDLISGKTNDFPLWGKSIAELTGGSMHAGNVRVEDFNSMGRFKIPEDPKKELMNHLIIDFFTKTSLPLPFTSYLADYNEMLAKMMISMYSEGLNLKNVVGNVSAVAVIQLVTHGYVYLFKALPEVSFFENVQKIKNADAAMLLFNEINEANERYVNSNEFYVLQMIAHASSFLVDSVLTTVSKNYTGILSLDYASLLILANNTLKYVSGGIKDYRAALKSMREINLSIEDANDIWFNSFKDEVLALADSESFQKTFSPRFMIEYHEDVMQSFSEAEEKKSELLAELQEWEINENN